MRDELLEDTRGDPADADGEATGANEQRIGHDETAVAATAADRLGEQAIRQLPLRLGRPVAGDGDRNGPLDAVAAAAAYRSAFRRFARGSTGC